MLEFLMRLIKMTPPSVRVNTFFQKDLEIPRIDFISKIFIFLQLPLGIVRVSLLPKIKICFVALALIYSISSACVYITFVFWTIQPHMPDSLVICLCLFQYIFFVIFNFALNKRLESFYDELKKFNIEASTEPKVGKETIRNAVQTVLSIIYIFGIFSLLCYNNEMKVFEVHALPSVLSQNLELYFIAHLLSLLIPRLRLIKQYIRSLGSNNEEDKYIEKTEICKMEKIMNLYHYMIKAHNFMIDAIKWQALVALITSFGNLLTNCYFVSLGLIRKNSSIISLVIFLGQVTGVMGPLFAICTLGDRVHGEVQQFREILASKLYGSQLDKRSRGVARALLSWTETRDMSFRLLRMVYVDIALPFKFAGLLVTYLIILLQFEKVINP